MMAHRMSGEAVVDYFRTVYKHQPTSNDAGRLIDSATVRRAIALYHGSDPRTEKQEPAREQQRRNQEVIDAMLRGAVDEGHRLLNQIDAPSNDNAVNPGWERAEGTLWGAYNVVTYIADHAPMRSYASDDHRLDSALYGQTDIKSRATIAAAELVA